VVLEPVAGGSAWAQVQHKLEGLYGFELVELTAEQEARIMNWEARSARWKGQVNGAGLWSRIEEVAAHLECKELLAARTGRKAARMHHIVVLRALILDM